MPAKKPQVSEKYVERRICLYAKKTGWLARKLQWVGTHGAPDRFFVKDGRIVLMEIKRPGGKATAHQAKEIDRLYDAGVEVYLVDDIEEAKRILDRRPNWRRRGCDLI